MNRIFIFSFPVLLILIFYFGLWRSPIEGSYPAAHYLFRFIDVSGKGIADVVATCHVDGKFRKEDFPITNISESEDQKSNVNGEISLYHIPSPYEKRGYKIFLFGREIYKHDDAERYRIKFYDKDNLVFDVSYMDLAHSATVSGVDVMLSGTEIKRLINNKMYEINLLYNDKKEVSLRKVVVTIVVSNEGHIQSIDGL